MDPPHLPAQTYTHHTHDKENKIAKRERERERERDGSKSQLEPNSMRRQQWLEVEDFLRWVERGRSGQQWCVGWR